MDIPKSQIRSLVGRYHVGTSDSTIRAEIRNRTMSPTTGQLMKGWTPSLVRKAEDYAIKIHRANQALYGYVMSGASMRNPRSRRRRGRSQEYHKASLLRIDSSIFNRHIRPLLRPPYNLLPWAVYRRMHPDVEYVILHDGELLYAGHLDENGEFVRV